MNLPATDVHAIAPVPFELDYDALSSQARHARCVFRVWEPTSTSPLVWSGFKDNSGFHAPNGNVGVLSPGPYMECLRGFRGKVDWAEGAYMKQTVVDHILGRERQTALPDLGNGEAEGEGIPEDEKSPWISTCKNLSWCVWEISRRLALPARSGSDNLNGKPDAQNLAAQRDTDPKRIINLAIIRHHPGMVGLNDARRRYLELHLDARGLTGRIVREDMPMQLQRDCDRACRVASQSQEVLYYGRIFPDNIDCTMEFTSDYNPLPLPPFFFAHPSIQPSPTLGNTHSWLSRLVWDPCTDDYLTACAKMECRKWEIRRDIPRLARPAFAEESGWPRYPANTTASSRGRTGGWQGAIRARGRGGYAPRAPRGYGW